MVLVDKFVRQVANVSQQLSANVSFASSVLLIFFRLFTAFHDGELLLFYAGCTNTNLSAHGVLCFPNKKRNRPAA